MGVLDGRVAIITGSGRGIGREHALLFATEGAKVVVNDMGVAGDGTGADRGPAHAVVDEITAAGGEAVANLDSVTDPEGARRLVALAIDHFGRLDVLVNNAGILRDRMVVNMTEAEWDAVISVHLKGHFLTTRAAAAHWREEHKAGREVDAAIVNTSSGAGLFGSAGQLNYTAAKAGIAAMTMVEAMELGRYGVRVNCIAPLARTRLISQAPDIENVIAPPDDHSRFDPWSPANISPLVVYLSTRGCPFTGGVFHVGGAEVALYEGWRVGPMITTEGRWTPAALAEIAPQLLAGRPPLASSGADVAEMMNEFLKRYAD